MKHFLTFTIPVRLCWAIGNLTATWCLAAPRSRQVLYQVAPVQRYRSEPTTFSHPKWVADLHWWARWHYEDITDDSWDE